MELNEIESKIASNEMTASQVFTQMKQHIPSGVTKLKRDALIIANTRRTLKAPTKTINWVLAMELFGTGSTTALRLCKSLGLDPESNKTNYGEMIRFLES